MLKEDQAWVAQIVKEEIAKIPPPETPKPVEVDIDEIVKKVLDKINITTTEIPVKKGKEK